MSIKINSYALPDSFYIVSNGLEEIKKEYFNGENWWFDTQKNKSYLTIEGSIYKKSFLELWNTAKNIYDNIVDRENWLTISDGINTYYGKTQAFIIKKRKFLNIFDFKIIYLLKE